MSKKTGKIKQKKGKIMKYKINTYIYIYINIKRYYNNSFKINKEYPTRVVMTKK